MRRYRKVRKEPIKVNPLKKKVTRNRTRAKFVGYILLFAVIALAAAVAILPMLTGGEVTLTAAKFWAGFKGADVKSSEGLTKLIVAALYALMFLGLLVNVFRAIAKLPALHKRKGTKADGFNHSAYAMHELGKIFSGSFVVIILTYFLINLLYKDMEVKGFALPALLGAGVLVHLFTGVVGGKISYFDFEGEHLVEQKREVGRFAPFLRNVFQLAGVFGMLYFLLKSNAKADLINELITKDVVQVFKQDFKTLAGLVANVLVLLCVAVLAKHATAITEYSIDGAQGRGMKVYRIFSFFVFLLAGVTVAWKFLVLKQEPLDIKLLTVAEIALAGFIVELIMRNMPRLPGEKKEKEVVGDENLLLDDQTEKEKEEVSAATQFTANATSAMPTMPQAMPPVPAQGYALPMQGYPMQYSMTTAPMQAQGQPQPPVGPALLLVPAMQPQTAMPAMAAPAPMQEVSLPAPVQEEEVEEEEIEQTPAWTGKAVPVELNCPYCGKRLRVNGGAQHHRCPVCDRVFAIRFKAGN